ncbi:hypothetical protein [Granulicella arctica]|uniref:Uncharacterized protein n=1 Tax=Granulicella arctica TaxID=940613 RepID=A0A7Y9TJQ2_9BACT|nr:hypothetical protein [Granulicella arctica]NYF78507.1 hypothetical protein [Granulicella arctica]
MQALPSVLLFGQDHQLVETRGWVLEKAGLRVHTAMSILDLDRIATREKIDLFVLCDSLLPKARTESTALIRSRWPLSKRLTLEPSTVSVELDPRENILSAMEGPRELITTIQKLLAHSPAPLQ